MKYNLLNILLHNCEKKYTRKLLSLSNVCKKLHNSINSIIINLVKSYYLQNKKDNLKFNFNVLFLYYLSWCNIEDIYFLKNIQKIEKNKFILNILNKKLNSGRFKNFICLQSPLYHYNLNSILFNIYTLTYQNNNILMLIRLGCSCKIINNILINILTDYYKYYNNTLIINININDHLLILRNFLIFCEPTYAKSIYELKFNKLIDYDTKNLLDKYLRKKKLLCYLRYNYGIIYY